MKIALVAGVQSGCGKTTATLALMQHLHTAGYSVAPFKSGPDFIDPMWHRAVTGRVSYNLDTHMMGDDACRERVQAGRREDVAIIEGVMGLFDGRAGVGGKGSSVDLARTLNISVWLVVDAKGMAGSIVPLVAGFCAEAKKVGVAISGIIANQVGSEYHAKLLTDLLSEHGLPPVIAWLDKAAQALPERHLGLKMPSEMDIPDFSSSLHTDADQLLAACDELRPLARSLHNHSPRLKNRCIAIARDEGCCFIYQDNIDWLKEQGAALQFFSPLQGDSVPENCHAVWLPGGYPELHAKRLSQSATWDSLRKHIEADKPVLAECGGMMLLGSALIDHSNTAWPMANILPYTTRMQDRLAALGFREDASGARGHEFHHSTRTPEIELPPAFTLSRGDNGMRYRNLRASYIHWWFPSAPAVVAGWLGGEV
ncbi:MAG: cobyrinate a,c-diamide synthase [Chromatiales bacterium]|nr:cobyrinate a,c-diamide synthase [Chromatiales bacterium]